MKVMRGACVLGFLTLLAAGCGRPEEPRHYQAPKDPQWRMLGAIATGKDATWFFKVVAAPEILQPARASVLAFLRALRLENGEIRWTLPAGWHEEKGAPGRLATYRLGDRDPRVEMTVTRLAGAGGGLLGNVSRWRDQMGLEPLAPAELESRIEKIDGVPFDLRIVDLVGPTRPGMGPSHPPAPSPAEAAPADSEGPVSYELPPGWHKAPPGRNRMMEFQVEDPAGKATVSLTGMEGDGGGIAANIDRWRGQAELEPLGDQAQARAATQILFVGSEAWFTEAIGPRKAILGVIAQTPAGSLFLKFEGSPAVASAQRDAFLRFAQSFRIRAHHD